MGIYDRDYYRDDDGGGRHAQWSMTVTLIVVNVAVFLVDVLLKDKRNESIIAPFAALDQHWYREPWKAYQLLTSGFLHSTSDIQHILFNMFALWMFGTKVEEVYGRREFLRMYLSSVILSGAVWTLAENIVSPGGDAAAVGASGAITALMMLYVLHFPHDTFLLFFVFPVPAWVLGVIFVVIDSLGVLGGQQLPGGFIRPHVAYAAHLGGALFGYIYYRTHWQLFWFLPRDLSWKGLKKQFQPKPKLRIRDEDPPEENLQERVDEILAKISRTGESSLTPDERRTLEEASRRYQKKRQ